MLILVNSIKPMSVVDEILVLATTEGHTFAGTLNGQKICTYTLRSSID
jgi:hypothetical protein